jgi:hypothetical protein
VEKLRRYSTFMISLKESTGVLAVKVSGKSCKCVHRDLFFLRDWEEKAQEERPSKLS